ncbi:MAG TPA: peptide deformylase [Longimicrobiales bacterium]|nr:peptide deformylase [Longimicrobiales bacterium]
MARLEVRILGDPVLRAKAQPVKTVSEETHRLIRDMFDTMYNEEGVGLAAPQVGVSERIIVVDPHMDDHEAFALINPEIIEASKESEKGEEGCLSIPGLRDLVERSIHVKVRGMSPEGEVREFEADDLVARILQHEIDHLDGVLFIDRMGALKRKLLLAKWQKIKP